MLTGKSVPKISDQPIYNLLRRVSGCLKWTGVFWGCLILIGCTGWFPSSHQLPVAVRHDINEFRASGCQGEECPLVNIDTVFFPDEPPLNRLIEAHLCAMTLYRPEDTLPVSLQSYQRDFLVRAKQGWSAWLQAKVRDWHRSILVIELSSYLAQGDAEGIPGRAFINYDLVTHRALSLQDLVNPGKEGAFWHLAEQAHQEWAKKNHTEPLAEFLEHWPFRATANIALLKEEVLLKYDVSEIAPYSSGHPELHLSFSQLKGILREKYAFQ